MSDLEQVAGEVRACHKCRLSKGRTKAVPGEGPANAELLFIGEAPGFYEDRQGRPFVGPSGKLLEEMLASIGLSRNQVFITNVIKCRPAQNRDPQQDEIEACQPYLDRQIEAMRPKVIVTLGRFSMQRYFPGQSITRIHGQVKRQDGVACIPFFHPAAALRNPQWMEALKADFKKLPGLVQEMGGSEQYSSPPDDFEQLSLF